MFLHALEPPPTLGHARPRPATTGGLSGGWKTRGESRDFRVSIVTVVRNAAATIGTAIESVMNQSVAVEHVVMDGGSTDGTIDVLRRYDDRLALWISEPDRGIADALNKGIALTTGRIVGLLHADDRYLPDAISDGVQALDANPSAGFSFGGCRYVGDRTEFIVDADPNYARVIRQRMPAINHPTVFMRREVYERIGLFRPSLRVAMDYDLLLRAHNTGVRGVALPRVIAEMRLGGASMTHPVRGHYESMLTSVDQGRGFAPATATFAISAVGALGRLSLEKIGANGVVDVLRRWRNPTSR